MAAKVISKFNSICIRMTRIASVLTNDEAIGLCQESFDLWGNENSQMAVKFKKCVREHSSTK